MDDGYTTADVKRAARRIRAECPDAIIEISNFGYTLAVVKPDQSGAFIIFDASKDGPAVISDIDDVLAALKASTS